MSRVFYVDEVRDLIRQYDKEEISLSRFVEILNEKATGLSAIELYKIEAKKNSNSSAALLSKSEAIQALSEGKKVTHRCFTDDEFVYQEGDWYYDENGYRSKPELFWWDRKSPVFETGWSLYGG